MKRFWRRIKILWKGLFVGLKATEQEVFTQSGISEPLGTSIIQEVSTERVAKDLLAGKETQQVQELRYRTYRVERESKDFEYYSPLLAIRREKQDTKFVKYENSDELKIITIQNNFPVGEDLLCDMKRVVDTDEAKRILGEMDSIIKSSKYFIKIKYNKGFFPRYNISEFIRRLVVKEGVKSDTAVLDFYVSVYPDPSNLRSKGFVKEIEKIKDNGLRSDIIDIRKASFFTYHAYGAVDMLKYEFDELEFVKIVEYDGNYIIRYNAHIATNGEDMITKYHSESMAAKYENKEEKTPMLNATDSFEEDEYVCVDCGKRVPRDKMDNGIQGSTEYMDMQIAEQTVGRRLCKKCLQKFLNKKTF